jgi:two-component system, sensor histidine kinase
MSTDGRFVPPLRYRSTPRRRILVVDDSIDAADSLAILLRHLGHDVQVAHDGHAALEAARLNRPQVVLLDLGMPGVNGYRVVERLRGESGFNGIAFVAVTGSGEPEVRERTREAGFAAHVVKPVSLEALQTLLERL